MMTIYYKIECRPSTNDADDVVVKIVRYNDGEYSGCVHYRLVRRYKPVRSWLGLNKKYVMKTDEEFRTEIRDMIDSLQPLVGKYNYTAELANELESE